MSAGISRKLRRHELLYTARKGGLIRKRGDLGRFSTSTSRRWG
ncbi:MAG: hypothetical protein M5U35_07250 [Roseovarius sp.]|nr:hypothetical protein [Roseovarius sp.]